MHRAAKLLMVQRVNTVMATAPAPDLDARVMILDQTASVEQRMVYQTRLQEVRDAIASLPAKQRAAVLMHKYEEMEYSQIANVLDCSESAVKSLLFRAYESLRGSLGHMVTGGK